VRAAAADPDGMETTGQGRDPFADLVLDDAFVGAAQRTEPSARERARPPAAAWSTAYASPPRHQPTARPPWGTRAAACAVVVLALAWSSPFLGSDEAASTGLAAPTLGQGPHTPTPRPAPSGNRLRAPADAPATGGPHAFVSVDDDGSPVSYDPCRPVTVVVNDRSSLPDGDRMLTQALAEISTATGLVFHVEGPTDEPPDPDRRYFQPDRYGDRWAPVLIAWSDPQESPELAGDIAGVAGSAQVQDPDTSTSVYVSGTVVLDGPELAEVAHHSGWYQAKAVVVHELGHPVGLDHVDDPRQLMHASGHLGVVDPQPGDLAGLARLGQGACHEQL